MAVFWRKGFEDTSLTDLTAAMGISRPSLYNAFGNKEQLYLKVIERYGREPTYHVDRALAEPDVREALRKLLHGVVEAITGEAASGCLMVRGRLTCGGAEEAQAALQQQHEAMDKRLRRRLQQAKRDGQLSADASVSDLAGYLMSVLSGLSVEASSGVSRARLRRVADLAVETLARA